MRTKYLHGLFFFGYDTTVSSRMASVRTQYLKAIVTLDVNPDVQL
jgi:hypothetical protein